MIEVTYKGVDITQSVSVNRCYHDMYASDQTDTLHLRLNDVRNLWDSWGPQDGDEIRIDYGTINTGTMFVSSVQRRNGFCDIVAQAAPKSGFKVQNKAWQQVRLLQLGEEIANRNGLAFSSYGVTDRLYSYILQDGQSDFAFLNQRAKMEGCSFLVYNKRLILYSEAYMESITPSELLEVSAAGQYSYYDRRAELYGSCIVEAGEHVGEFSANNGSPRVYRPQNLGGIGGAAEAERFAKGLLRAVNKDCCGGFVRANVLTGYAAASVIELSNPRAPSWDGPVFLHHIRNDYGNGTSKIFFRKPLEGY